MISWMLFLIYVCGIPTYYRQARRRGFGRARSVFGAVAWFTVIGEYLGRWAADHDED